MVELFLYNQPMLNLGCHRRGRTLASDTITSECPAAVAGILLVFGR